MVNAATVVILTPEVQALTSKKSWDEGAKIAALVERLEGFESPVPCDISITLSKSAKEYGVALTLSANGQEGMVVDDCLPFRQVSVVWWSHRVSEKDLISAAIISIGSQGRLGREWIPFMREASINQYASPWLQHEMPSGVHAGPAGILAASTFGRREVEPIKIDSSWEKYYVSIGSSMVYFLFPPQGWTCDLKTTAQVKEEEQAAERSAAANGLQEMQKHVGWKIQSITTEGITIVSPCGVHSEIVSAGHSVWDYGDSSESYLRTAGVAPRIYF